MEANKKQIAALLDKYFEGLTSLREEQTLQDYFQADDISEELRIYQPIFQYFAEKPLPQPLSTGEGSLCQHASLPPSPAERGWGRGLLAIAASLLLLITVRLAFHAPETSLAYIDGHKQTDIAVIQAEALRALEILSAENDAVYSSQIDALDIFLNN
jgi:hypothetical protein